MTTATIFGKSRVTIAIALGLLFLVLYISVLGVRPLFMPDELRYGEIAREMLASGNWITPRLNGLLYFEKPPFGHWLNALSLFLFGENEFAVRFASAVAAGVSAITTYFVSRHFFKSATAPFLATFIFLTIFEVQAIGTFSTLDSMFSAILNAGIAVFAFAAGAPLNKQRLYLLAAGVLLGIAFMTKGLLAFVLPGIVLLPWLLYRRDYALLFKRSWIAVAAAIIISLPWALAIHQQQPDFWRYFIWVEHIQRFAAENAQHKAPFYYFLMYLPFVTIPWFFMLPAAIKGLRSLPADNERQSGVLFVLLWALVPLLFFSVASGKLITYILPCMIPFAVLLGVGLDAARKELRLLRLGLGLTALLILLGLAALLVAQFTDALYQPYEVGRFWTLAGTLAAAVLVLAAGAFVKSDNFRLLASGLGAMLVFFVLQFSLPNQVMQHKAPAAFLTEVSASLPADGVVMVNGSLVRAVSWSLRRSDVYVIEDKGETAYGLDSADGAGRFLEPAALAVLLQRSRQEHRDVLVLCKRQCNDETRALLPGDVETSSWGNFYAYRIYSTALGGNSNE
jgi:4-amino-4-deoxy-L-arabinose transferase